MIKLTEECIEAVASKFISEVRMTSQALDDGIAVDISVDSILEENSGFLHCMSELAENLFDNQRDMAAGVVMAVTAYRIFKAQYESEQMS